MQVRLSLKWFGNGTKLWIPEFLNLQTVRFKLNFQVENSQVFLWMVRVSIGGESWRARSVWIELQGPVFIAIGTDICMLEKLLNLDMVMHKLAWACTSPWSNPIWSMYNCSEVQMRLGCQGNVKWDFEHLISSNDTTLLRPCATLANLIQNAWNWVLLKA